MKLFKIFSFVLVTVILSSCGLTKMTTKYNTVKFNVTPTILETHAGKVNIKLDAQFPEKYFAKKSIVEFTPVLIHEGGETSFKTIKVQGEEASGGEATIFYSTGGKFNYEDNINYTSNMINSKLELRANAKMQEEKTSASSVMSSIAKLDKEQPLGPIILANGVIATANRVLNNEDPAFASHGYEKETILSESATVYFLVNQSSIRTTEKSKDAVKRLKEFASQGNKTSSVEIKSYASPEGTLDFNDNVSERRMKSTLRYVKWLMKRVGLDGANNTALYSEKSIGEDWDGFNKLMNSSKIKDKMRINRIVNSVEDLEKREQAIRDMTELYDAIEKEILPQLRKSEITVRSYAPKKTDEEILTFLMSKDWGNIDVQEALYGVTLAMESETTEEVMLTMYEQISTSYNDWRGYNNIACYYLNNNNITKAKEYLEKAENIGGDQNEILINKGIIASWNNNLTTAQKLFDSGNASENNQAILNIRKGEYKKAARFFKNKHTHNATLAKLLSGNNDSKCKESTASCYYLNAIIGARSNNESMVLTNLKKAIAMNSNYKKEVKKDLEFRNYFGNIAFEQLVN